jgi:hypothetical protein
MEWPWTSRKALRDAEERARVAENRAIAADSRLADYMEASQTCANIGEAERKALREEVKLLLDRIVQMSGQPPIFNPAPTPPTPAQPEPSASTIPGPATRLSFDDIHRETRKAIKDGKIGILAGAN